MGYIKPTPKNGVSFTKNLTESNYNAGENYLAYYFRDSKLSKPPYYPNTNFVGMVNYLKTNYPTYIESLGELSKSVDGSKIIQAMKNAAARGLTDYPRPAYFNTELMKLTGVSIGSVVSETISEIGDDLVLGSRVLLVLMVLGGLVVGYIYVKPFLPKGAK